MFCLKEFCRYRQKPAILLLTSFQILPIGQNNPALPLLAEPDCLLYFVFQVVGVRCFRCDEGIDCELCPAEIGDEAIGSGFAVDECPGIEIPEEPFLLLAEELIREKVLAIRKKRLCFHSLFASYVRDTTAISSHRGILQFPSLLLPRPVR